MSVASPYENLSPVDPGLGRRGGAAGPEHVSSSEAGRPHPTCSGSRRRPVPGPVSGRDGSLLRPTPAARTSEVGAPPFGRGVEGVTRESGDHEGAADSQRVGGFPQRRRGLPRGPPL